jgi:hypothetical protein
MNLRDRQRLASLTAGCGLLCESLLRSEAPLSFPHSPMPIASIPAGTSVFTFTEDDLQETAKFLLHRKLSPAELQEASRIFAKDIDWFQTAEYAIREAVEENP